MSIIGNPLLIGGGGSNEDLPIGSTITVTSDEGASITASRGSKSFTEVVGASGTVSFTVHESGRWNLIAMKSGETALTDTVDVLQDNTTYSKTMMWRIPTDIYQEVEWLRTNGTPYIDTGVAYDENLSFYLKINAARVANSRGIIGGTSGWLFGLYRGGNGQILGWGNDTTHQIYGTLPLTITEIECDKDSLTIDGSRITTKYSASGQTISGNMRIPAPIGGNYSPADLDIYSHKIYLSGTIIRDYIPCYRKSDSVAGLWDSANKVFYPNAGDGAFIVGGDVN